MTLQGLQTCKLKSGDVFGFDDNRFSDGRDDHGDNGDGVNDNEKAMEHKKTGHDLVKLTSG